MDERVTQATDKLLKMWESGDMPEAVAKIMLRRQDPAGSRPSDRWSLSNQLIMMSRGTDDARTFKQWQEVGRQVRKGSKAFHILAPAMRKVAKKDKNTGEETTISILYGFKGVPEFAIEDTDGEPIPQSDYTPAILPPLAEVAEAWGVKVTYGAGSGSFFGWYEQGTDRIHLVTHAEKTFFHELAHAAHGRVIGELKGKKDSPTQYAAQEVVAETAAAALCILYGIKGYEVGSREYVAGWGKTTPEEATKAVIRHIAEIQKVLDLILTSAKGMAGRTETAAGSEMAVVAEAA